MTSRTPEANGPTEAQHGMSSKPTTTIPATVDQVAHVEPAIVEEQIRPHVHTEFQVQRTRSIHIHEHRTIIQPIIEKAPKE